MPYIRSIWQSFFCSDNVVGLRYTLDWLSDSFLFEIAGIRRPDLTYYTTALPVNGTAHVRHSLSKSPRQLTRTMIDDFLNRLLGQLVNHLSSLAQNRSRGKRRLAAAYESLLEISMQASAIDDSLEEEYGANIPPFLRFGPSVQWLTLDTMMHIVLSGFELKLYRADECGTAYWIAQRIAEEKGEVLRSIIEVRGGNNSSTYLLSDLVYTESIAKACSAMQSLYVDSHSAAKHDVLPWTPFKEDLDIVGEARSYRVDSAVADPLAIHKIAFFKRYKWLRGRGRPESAQTLENLWHAYTDNIKVMKARSVSDALGTSVRDDNLSRSLHFSEETKA